MIDRHREICVSNLKTITTQQQQKGCTSMKTIVVEEKTRQTDVNRYTCGIIENPSNIKFVPSNTPFYGALVELAIDMDSSVLEFVDVEYKTKTVCLEAIIDNPSTIKFVPTDKPFYNKLARIAVKLDGSVLEFIPYECQDLVMAVSAIKQNYYNAKFMNPELINRITIKHIATQNGGIFFKKYDDDGFDYRENLSEEERRKFDMRILKYNGSNLCFLDFDEITDEMCKCAFFDGTEIMKVLQWMNEEQAHSVIDELLNRLHFTK